MKVAIVGCGGLGNVHADSYANIPGVTVVGVCDIVEEMAQRTADRVGAKAYVSFSDMLEQSGCDIVSITLPSYMHKEFAVQAAEAGKHVISEKPIALNLEDARAMIDACKNNGVRLFVGHVVRFFPEYVQIKQQIDGGSIGKLGVSHAKRVGGHPGEVRNWYFDESKSGGVVLDLMIHDIDFMRWAGGEVRSVFGLHKNNGLLEYATATLVFESGAVANLEAQWGYPGPFVTAAEFAGTGGVVRCDSSRSKSLQVRKSAAATGGGQFVEVPQSPGYESPYELELRHFIQCIRDNSEPVVTAEDAYKALEIALAAVESARTGKAILIGQDTREVSPR
ncbi:Gfo/Idh/MocA family protein [Paenibacillus contaminans]|uniref:Gfo/Idh/MocA family oxidoreductase n=1 Tax=Paenibacillus contaminans TaxID=450362 RepID=A0A329MR81_9BACL|nr:Gfo/Idh/MocA family oxidoreductase [Paenibacillus contaminans]RAV22479.1 gfo/Idh/MocA family oxidoreductase [Paenibacillus contaminans]